LVLLEELTKYTANNEALIQLDLISRILCRKLLNQPEKMWASG
jgi:hypothetical protein